MLWGWIDAEKGKGGSRFEVMEIEYRLKGNHLREVKQVKG